MNDRFDHQNTECNMEKKKISDYEANFIIAIFEDNSSLLRTLTSVDLQWVTGALTFFAVGGAVLLTEPPQKSELISYIITRLSYIIFCLVIVYFIAKNLEHNHRRRVEAVTILKKTQSAMGMFQSDRYVDNTPIIDDKFQKLPASKIYVQYIHTLQIVVAIKFAVFIILTSITIG